MIAAKQNVGVLGAASLIGECLLPLLIEKGWDVVAFSRRKQETPRHLENLSVEWQLLNQEEPSPADNIPAAQKKIAHWICLAPIWSLSEYFSLLSLHGVKHIVALSSTTIFTKDKSSSSAEKMLTRRLADSEERLVAWAKTNNVTWTILRPTLMYGLGRDRNISMVARFIRRFAFFPLLGSAQGLRQPIYAHDVATACSAALSTGASANRSYNLSGGETLSYQEMVNHIFLAMGRKPRFANLPLWPFRIAFRCLHILPYFRHWSVTMAERMNQDLVFDHEDARRDLDFIPQPFVLTRKDLPWK
jgi:nucleoside-diphosphate-sugar epimerase